MDRAWFAAAMLASFVGTAAKCPPPAPTPAPTPTVAPTPTPTPEPTPTPTPTPTPAPDCSLVPLTGTPVMGAGKHGVRVYDCTPKLTDAARCRAMGMDRVTCPVVSECPGYLCECRGQKELELMGGPPIWQLEDVTGNLRWGYDEDPPWKARIIGTGTGKLRACYTNMRACSEWIEVSY